MENRKDIGKAFREKLSLIEKSPDAALWNRIENDLQKKQKKRHRKLLFFIVVILSVFGIMIRTLMTENTSIKGDDFILRNEAYSGKAASEQDRQNQNSGSSEIVYSGKTINSDKTGEEFIEQEYAEEESIGEEKHEKHFRTEDAKTTNIKETTKSGSTKAEGVNRVNGTAAANGVSRATGVKTEKTIEAGKKAKSNYLKTKTTTEKNNNSNQLVSYSASATGNPSVAKNTYSKVNRESKTTLTAQKQRNRSKNKSKSGHSTSNSDEEYKAAIEKIKNNTINNNEAAYQVTETKKNNVSDNNRIATSGKESATTNKESSITKNGVSTNTVNDSITNNIVAACVEEIDSLQNQKKENKNPLKEQEEKEEDKKGKTKIDIIASVFYAPTVSGSLTGKSLINESFNDYSLKKTLTNSFGAYLGIKHKNLGIRVGYVKVDLENSVSINNNQGNPISNYSNIVLNGGITPATINNHFASSENVTIVQKASYANIPLEFKYTVFNKNRFGVDAIGGISIILLEKNTLEMYGNNAGKITIGKTDNQSKMNLGLNLGVGLNYKLTQNLQLDVNPVLTYLHNVGNDYYKPYSLLLQSGFSYRF